MPIASIRRASLAFCSLLLVPLLAACGGDDGKGSDKGGDGEAGAASNGGAAGNGGSGNAGGASNLPAFDAGDPSLNNVAAGAVCDRLATIQCAGEAHCCASPGRTVEDCKTLLKQQCAADIHLDDISKDPVAGFDAAKAAAAFTEFSAKAAACDASITVWASTTAGLRGIAQGTIPFGAACGPPSSTEEAKIAGALASCAQPDANSCLPGASTWQCAARSDAGGNCFTDANCKDGLYCDNPALDIGPAITCKARKADGAACVTPNECSSLACKNKTCAPSTAQTAFCLKQ